MSRGVWVRFILVVGLLVGCAALAVNAKPNLGLDLKGGAQFVFQAHEEDEVRVVVNPEITARSEENESGDEGCLSLQGVLVPVERSLTVTLEGLDVEGKPLRLELEELAARVVQHELDHLDGTLMIERTDPESRREALATLRRRPSL